MTSKDSFRPYPTHGWLRVTTTHSLGTTWIAPLLGEFPARHPEARGELLLSNDKLDIIAGEIDVALRVGRLANSNLAARTLNVFRCGLHDAELRRSIRRAAAFRRPDRPHWGPRVLSSKRQIMAER